MKEFFRFIGAAILAVAACVGMVFVVAGLALALASPLILITWLIIQAVS